MPTYTERNMHTENPTSWVPLPNENLLSLQEQLTEYKKSLPGEDITQTISKIPDFPIVQQNKESDPLFTFKKKMKTWPIHLSYEGSAFLCVIIALNETSKHVSINQLPKIDQDAILKSLGTDPYYSFFEVEFDHIKDFILTFGIREGDTTRDHQIIAFNTVAHPRSSDVKESSTVRIEENGETFQVGGKITLNKKNIPKLAGISSSQSLPEHENSSRPLMAVNRNAYEIRADVLKMALSWAQQENANIYSEDEVLKIAKKFYAFVENKR